MVPSGDVLQMVAERLTGPDRLSLASTTQKNYDLLRQWSDVTSLLLDTDEAHVAGKIFTGRLEKAKSSSESATFLEQIAALCPSIHKISIQHQLGQAEINALVPYAPYLRQLDLSSDNFLVTARGWRTPVFNTTFPKLKTLGILKRIDEGKLLLKRQMTLQSAEELFSPSLEELRLTGIALRSEVLTKIGTLTNLRVLHLSGCIVDTVSALLIVNFDKLTHLTELSLPASLFSIHRPPPPATKKIEPLPFTLKQLTNLQTLDLHCEMMDNDFFKRCIEEFFPKNLVLLRLNGFTCRLPDPKKLDVAYKFQIQFVRPDVIKMKAFKGSNDNCKLISEMYWCDPYRPIAIPTPERWATQVPEATKPFPENQLAFVEKSLMLDVQASSQEGVSAISSTTAQHGSPARRDGLEPPDDNAFLNLLDMLQLGPNFEDFGAPPAPLALPAPPPPPPQPPRPVARPISPPMRTARQRSVSTIRTASSGATTIPSSSTTRGSTASTNSRDASRPRRRRSTSVPPRPASAATSASAGSTPHHSARSATRTATASSAAGSASTATAGSRAAQPSSTSTATRRSRASNSSSASTATRTGRRRRRGSTASTPPPEH
ncbi:unnamed protein product, partial [Mesorhabditis spiculigera]